ncbi:Clp protease ClpP [Agrobacterium vitis]|uniref:head maturation protease, ClpP-related n=1 Tax=Agrobacterium vitis TaxID=373 RepID=UPI001F15864A|nr:head maturation protease, ClpP-related [Agrobacterium vitis]MCE6073395.1 Clp protease ClpP [Agrobacterium vitis]
MTVLVNGELVLYGFVGENYWGDGFTARDVVDALMEHGRDEPITVRINSGGGYVDDGIAIFNALTAHKGQVTVVVDSMAASSASIIAMAGDERIMRTGSMMMIHDPSGAVWGTAADMEKYAKVMEKHAENLASIYAEVTGEDASDIREDMKSELWMTAEEAVERSFATSLEKKKAKAAAAHDYSVYAHAPERLVALSTQKNWTRSRAQAKAGASAAASTGIEKEKPTMTDKTVAEHSSAEQAKIVADAVAKALADSKTRVKAILASDEAKGREELAEHFAHDTDMSAEAALAALAKAPKAEQQEQPEPKPTPPSASYEQQRLAAANLAMPGASQPSAKSGPKINATDIYKMRREALKGA